MSNMIVDYVKHELAKSGVHLHSEFSTEHRSFSVYYINGLNWATVFMNDTTLIIQKNPKHPKCINDKALDKSMIERINNFEYTTSIHVNRPIISTFDINDPKFDISVVIVDLLEHLC